MRIVINHKMSLLGSKALKETRDVVREQGERIRSLERQILVMRQRRQWGEVSSASAESLRQDEEDEVSLSDNSGKLEIRARGLKSRTEESYSDSSSRASSSCFSGKNDDN